MYKKFPPLKEPLHRACLVKAEIFIIVFHIIIIIFMYILITVQKTRRKYAASV